ncbi:hypothetical protein AVEN_97837-1 [Araneus ventricosus]|uniref:Reverse transcriptase domain-containing protein n=1 Tax=Araneus ventricosus TaxID=182803 RepID=A0A4Y2U1A1_ARAVE|nr:hypothetical protein AVEN_97837-1 [Araneus ventricosus]
MENLKLKRKVIRTAASKLFTRIENKIKNTIVYKCSLEESLKLLTIKAEELSKLDLQIEELLDSLDSFETEFEASPDYAEMINVWQFRDERKLNELTGSSESINDNKQVVRLPKLTIPKFNGDSLYWNSFWNSFRVSIHDNTSLAKVEKYNYLRSYLSAKALIAIEGFLISDENYDSALEILKNRFGHRDIVIHAHMNKLLNLPPVHRSDDIVKLRHLYDTLEIHVRSLKSLDVKPEAYSRIGDHKSYSCRVGGAYERKEQLHRKGLCFFCLGKHTSRQCIRRRPCNRCRGQHNQALSFKEENRANVSHMELLENKSEVGGAVAESQVLSTISERNPQCVLLQTCDVKIRNDTKVTRARLLLDNGSMRSFVDKDIACKLKLPVIRRESLSVFTVGNKSPIKKTFDVVRIVLENREKPDFSVKIEALVTEQISGFDLPPSNLKAEIVQKFLEGFQLSDSCSKGKVAVLVGADYYHYIVLGGMKRLKGELVATETIFGWCLIGRNSDRIIELVPNTCDTEQITFYLPHREVVRNDRSSCKFRVVFDASSHDVGEVSLNDCLHIGPNLYPDIFDLLLRFRLYPIAFTADIKQAFLQIEVNEKDRDVSRFLFTDDPTDGSKSPQIYRFTRVLFGVNSSPFMLAATIKHHLREYQGIYPETSDFLNNCIYVDDIIGGHQNTEDAYRTSRVCVHIFRGAGLPFKVLGVSWNKREDSFYFDVQNLVTFLSGRVNSKRCLLQAIGRIFDPVGFLGPFVLRVKLLMQEIWKLSLDWDDDLSECLSLAWNRWCNEVPGLDLASRGTNVFELRDNPVWFQGPEWLELTSEYWPMQNNAILEGLDGSELEYRKTVSNVIQFGCNVNSEKLLVLENYSSLRRLYRVTAWIKRFIKRVKKIVTTKGPLTTEELEEAEMYWIQVEQRQCYSEEFETLAGVGQVKKNSSLYNFGPFLYDKEILKMGGRLEYSDFSSDKKHPIILPRNSSLTGLIVQDEHICMKHGGISTTLAKLGVVFGSLKVARSFKRS